MLKISNTMKSVNVNLAEVFGEGSENFAGTKTKADRKVTTSTLERRKAERTIYGLAQKTNTPISTVVTKILKQSINALRRYVVAHNETPAIEPMRLAMQAVLLRADEVGTISKAIDTDDNDSLLQIETAEDEAVQNSHPDAKNILPTDVQAAIKIVLDRIASQYGQKKSGKLSDFVQQLKQSSSNGFDIGPVDPNYGSTWIAANTTLPPETSGTNDIFSIFDKISNSISKIGTAVSGAIGKVSGSVQDAKGVLGDTASDIGADSIKKALSDYLPVIIAGIVAIVIIIVIAIYASKHK